MTRSARAATAAIFLSINASGMLLAGSLLTSSTWDTLTYKSVARAPHPGELLVSHLSKGPASVSSRSGADDPDEYEACERVRYRSGVRAPSNAYSSVFFLSAPTYQLFSNEHIWSARGTRNALFGLTSIVLGVGLTHASFLYHASITVELNRLDVRWMLLWTIHNTIKCVFLASRLLIYLPYGAASWRRALRRFLTPAFGGCYCGAIVLASATDSLHRNYDVLLQSTVGLMFVVSIAWAVTPSQPPGGLGRRAGGVHLVLFLSAIAFKLLDDTKVLCTTPRARDSPLQLTAAFHALTAAASMMSDMHTSSQLSHDTEVEMKRE